MDHRRLLQAVVIVVGIGAAAAAGASVVQQCVTIDTQMGQDCFTAGISCTPTGDCDVNIQCNPDYGSVAACGSVEEATTPLPIYGSFNPTTLRHEYKTSNSLDAGFESEGVLFQLANDNYNGAIELFAVSGAAAFYVRPNIPTALPYLVPFYEWYNPQRGDTLYSLRSDAAAGLPCNITGHPSGPPTVDCWQGGGVWGYVGLPCGQMHAGSTVLWTNQGLTSCDGRFHLVMQSDGNLVLYQDIPMTGGAQTALWSTGTWGTTGQLAELNYSGQLVVYGAGGSLLYQSTTADFGGSFLAVQNDGNVVIYQQQPPWGNVAVWWTGTSGH
jgi:hypothetical protein